ncbi:MAG: energy-coupling factor transporter ATPase [Eubacteriaceae bacterium]
MSLKLLNVSHIYAKDTPFEFAALKDININIDKTEFIAVIGHTGSGKSTLVQHMNGLLLPTSGTIFIDDVDITQNKTDRFNARRKVGLVFQYAEHQLFEETIFRDIAFGPKNLKLTNEEIEARVCEAMELVGLPYEEYKDRSPFDISGGQMRRVAIAGVLSMKPDIIILDEPTAGLDPLGKKDILNSIFKLYKTHNITVILVSHNMEEVAQMAERIIVMCQGGIIMDAAPAQVFSQAEKLEEIGLRAPDISYLMKELKKHGLDIDGEIFTVDGAKEELLKKYRGGDINV